MFDSLDSPDSQMTDWWDLEVHSIEKKDWDISSMMARMERGVRLVACQVVLEVLGLRRRVNFPVSAADATALADCCASQPFASELQRQAI